MTGMTIAKGTPMPRRLREAAGTTAVLLLLIGILFAINPTVRERANQVVDSRNDPRLAPGRAVSHVVTSTKSRAMSFASENSYLVFFLIGACLLFFFMLRT